MSIRRKGGRQKMAITIAQVKPLDGKHADKFYASLKTSKVRKEAIEKSKKVFIRGFSSK